jgi:hypothetical protein
MLAGNLGTFAIQNRPHLQPPPRPRRTYLTCPCQPSSGRNPAPVGVIATRRPNSTSRCTALETAGPTSSKIRFARGAFEGMLRYQTGVRIPPEGMIDLAYVDLAIPEGNEAWSGVRLKLTNDEKGLHVNLVPQAAFFDQRSERWVHFTSEELDKGHLAEREDLKKTTIRIYARSSGEHDIVISKLAQHGVTFQREGALPPPPEGLLEAPEMEVEITLRLNLGIRRCVAKYAFNYLASVCGSAFVPGSDFDVIRRFIRNGETPAHALVVAGSMPILHEDRPSKRQTDGHLITLSWADSGTDLVGAVSLFNTITYRISLCRQFAGRLWLPIRNGIH